MFVGRPAEENCVWERSTGPLAERPDLPRGLLAAGADRLGDLVSRDAAADVRRASASASCASPGTRCRRSPTRSTPTPPRGGAEPPRDGRPGVRSAAGYRGARPGHKPAHLPVFACRAAQRRDATCRRRPLLSKCRYLRLLQGEIVRKILPGTCATA